MLCSVSLTWDQVTSIIYFLWSSIILFLQNTELLGIPILHYFIFFAFVGAVVGLFFRSAKF